MGIVVVAMLFNPEMKQHQLLEVSSECSDCEVVTVFLMQMPFARIRENNWSIFFDFKGYVGARYDL